MKTNSVNDVRGVVITYRQLTIISLAILLFVLSFLQSHTPKQEVLSSDIQFYLKDEAAKHVPNPDEFYSELIKVADSLGFPYQWLAAVMYNESYLNPAQHNNAGGSARGLIQWMPITCETFGCNHAAIDKMSGIDQLWMAYKYLKHYKKAYGEYTSLADLYVSVLKPGARETGILYEKKSTSKKIRRQYADNSGLDYNKDGVVDIEHDIVRYMEDKFPPASQLTLSNYKTDKIIAEARSDAREAAKEDAKWNIAYATEFHEEYGKALASMN